MTSLNVATIDEDGHLNPAVFPETPPDGWGGNGGGGPQCVEFAFAGDLIVVPNDFYWISPGVEIRPTKMTASLGILPTLDGANPEHLTRFVVRVNSLPLATVDVTGGYRYRKTTTFTVPTIPPESFITCEVASVSAHAPTKQAFGLVQLWWEYV